MLPPLLELLVLPPLLLEDELLLEPPLLLDELLELELLELLELELLLELLELLLWPASLAESCSPSAWGPPVMTLGLHAAAARPTKPTNM